MSFRWFIYYCSLCGGCAAYVGWALGRMPPVEQHIVLAALRGMFLGLALAVGLTLVDAAWNLSGRDAAGVLFRILVSGVVGGMGGFFGGLIGQALYSWTALSLFLLLGWAVTGFLIGMAPGMFELLARLVRNEDPSGAFRKVLHGVLGGTLGGILGGLLYLALFNLWGLALAGRTDQFWSPSATGFVALGMCIGLLIALAQVILKEAWIRVEEGFRAGRELILTQPEITIGRAESCTIGLFGDNGIDKVHVRILRQGGRYLLEDADSQTGTYLNGERITRPTPLRAGDRIEIGRAVLRFGERQRREE